MLEKIQVALFPMRCKGRDCKRQEVLKEPVHIKVSVTGGENENERGIAIKVECPHIIGAFADRCDASHPGRETADNCVSCPYVLDLPHAMDKVVS